MTHKPPQRPGRLSVPWVTSARGSSDAQVGQAPVRARLVSLLLRPTAPPLALGVVVAAFLIVAETVLVYLLTQVAPGMAFGVVYLIGVLVVSTGWGFGLAAMTSVASALAFDYFHVWSAGSLIPTHAEDWVAIAVFLVVGLLANTLAGLARARAVEADQRRREADQRRREADLAAERAHALAELQAALRRVATLVARGVTPAEVYAAVATELARCLGMYYSALWRYEPDGAATLLVARDDDPGLKKMPVGARFSLEGDSVPALVLRSGRPARRWVRPWSSTAGCGGRPSSARRDPNPCPPTPSRGSPTSPSWSRPRSPTPRPTRNLPRLGPGSWRPPMMRGGVWNAICTTAPNSGWCRWGFSCASRRRRCPPNCSRSKNRFPTSSMVWWACRRRCKRSHAGFIPRSCPRADSAPRSRRWPAARRSRWSSISPSTDGCRSPPKWPPTTSSPKHSPTPPSTHEPRRRPCAPKPRTPTSTSGSGKTGS